MKFMIAYVLGKIRYIAILTIIFYFSANGVYAQGGRISGGIARHHNFYHKVDLEFGNIYSCALASCLTGYVNYLINDAMFETGYSYPVYRINAKDGQTISHNNVFGLSANDLLCNFQGGFKLGYQTYSPTFINWGVYDQIHYRVDNFMMSFPNKGDEENKTISNVLFGIGSVINIGRMEDGFRLSVEAGVNYSVCVNSDTGNSCNGLISHYAIGIEGPKFVQDIKLYADISHYNVTDNPINLSPITFGVMWAITPAQGERKK